MQKTTVIDVANCIIKKFKENGKSLSNMKLQKLIYYAYAIHLNAVGKPLFENEFQPWAYGPVHPRVYYEVKSQNPNPFNITNLLEGDGNPSTQDQETIELLCEYVYKVFESFNAKSLSELTHLPFGAWQKAIDRQEGSLNDVDIICEINTILNDGKSLTCNYNF